MANLINYKGIQYVQPNPIRDGGVALNQNFIFLADQNQLAQQHISATGSVHGATPNNTPNSIVMRNGSGNFVAGTITANSFVGNLTGNVTGNVSGNATTSTNATTHIARTDNPHSTTAAQVGNSVAQWNANKIQNVTVDNTAIADGFVLTYSATSGTIIYKAAGTAITSLGSIPDVSLSSVMDGQVLAFNASTSLWENQSPSSINIATNSDLQAHINASLVHGATASNVASRIVLRDINGNFSAGAISASQFIGGGSGLTSLNASNITSGTIANTYTTGSSSNTANTLVLRDNSGNFSANQITASFVGNLSGNATTSTNATVHIARMDNPHNTTAAQVGNTVAQWNANQIQGLPVNTTGITDGYALIYQSSTTSLVFQAVSSSSGAEYLADLLDVSLTTPANNDLLSYHSGTSKWINIPSSTFATETDFESHLTDYNNPHEVTALQVIGKDIDSSDLADGKVLKYSAMEDKLVYADDLQSAGADLHTYIYSQSIPASTWVINHNLGNYPTVTVVDSSGNMVFGDILYNDSNQITLRFGSPFSGDAYLNYVAATSIFTFGSPSTSWAINHNLNRFPSVTVVDNSGNVLDAAVQYVDNNNVLVTFVNPSTGQAFVN